MSPAAKAIVAAGLVAAVSSPLVAWVLPASGGSRHRHFIVTIITIVLCVAAGYIASVTGAGLRGALAGSVVGAITALSGIAVDTLEKSDSAEGIEWPLVAGAVLLWAVGGSVLGALGAGVRRLRLPTSDVPRTPSPLYTVFAAVLLLLSTGLAMLEGMRRHDQGPALLGAAMFPIITLGIVLAIAAATPRGIRPWQRAGRVGFWTTLVLFFMTCSTQVNRVVATQKQRTAAMAGLQIESLSIRHRQFGFAIPHPGRGFAIDSSQQRELDKRLTGRMFGWVLSHDSVPHVLMVNVLDSMPSGEQAVRGFADGIARSARSAGGRIIEDSLSWRDARAELRFSFVGAEGELRRTRCITGATSEQVTRIICVQTMSYDGDSLAFVREGLRSPAEP